MGWFFIKELFLRLCCLVDEKLGATLKPKETTIVTKQLVHNNKPTHKREGKMCDKDYNNRQAGTQNQKKFMGK
jgi:hypothetical protein